MVDTDIGEAVARTITVDRGTVRFRPAAPLKANHIYRTELEDGISDELEEFLPDEITIG